jgi:hypothetical protein
VPKAIRAAYWESVSVPTLDGLHSFAELYEARKYANGHDKGTEPLPATDDETAMVTRARTPRGPGVARPNAVKSTVETLFHESTDDGTRVNAATLLTKLVPDAAAKISRALLSNGATLPPLPDGGEDTVLADGRVFRARPTLERMIAERDDLI